MREGEDGQWISEHKMIIHYWQEILGEGKRGGEGKKGECVSSNSIS